jgi:hypothetical protein
MSEGLSTNIPTKLMHPSDRHFTPAKRVTVFSVRSESEMNAILESHLRSKDEILTHSQGNLETIGVLFARYRSVLSLIAYRVLGNDEDAEQAVQNCLRIASDHAPRFDHEGAFRSWLARILIDEAVTILHKQRISTPRHW